MIGHVDETAGMALATSTGKFIWIFMDSGSGEHCCPEGWRPDRGSFANSHTQHLRDAEGGVGICGHLSWPWVSLLPQRETRTHTREPAAVVRRRRRSLRGTTGAEPADGAPAALERGEAAQADPAIEPGAADAEAPPAH